MTTNYREAEGVNWSSLKHIVKSPAYYLYKLENPTPITDNMRAGSYVDCALLEPGELNKRYMVSPAIEWGSNEKKKTTVLNFRDIITDISPELLIALKVDEFRALVNERAALKNIEFIPETGGRVYNKENLDKLVEAQQTKPAWIELQKALIEAQKPLYATCPITGLKLKGLVDMLTINCIGDLKTIEQIDRRFYAIKDFMYVNQLAYYNYIAELNGINKDSHFLMFIESVAPYRLRLIDVPQKRMQAAHAMNLAMLTTLKECLDTGYFPDGSEVRESVYEEEEERFSSEEEQEWLDSQVEGQDSL
jgi:hypothetical protein